MALRTLVIAEKPAQGREIAKALGALKQLDGAMESSDYVVSWAIGHLVTLKDPGEYTPEWKYWNLSSLPILPLKYELKIIEQDHVKKQFQILKKLLTSKNFKCVVNACDAGREGELIFDYIYRHAGSTLPAMRLWTSAALTPEAIQREFLNLKPMEEFKGLRLAARARATADWAIGMNATRAMTLAMQSSQKPSFSAEGKAEKKTSYSVGRVQTPTLQFLVARAIEIQNFIPKPFWMIHAQLFTNKGESFPGRYEYKCESHFTPQIYTHAEALHIVRECEGKQAKISKVDSKETSLPPPLLFDLTELQKEGNKRFSFRAEETLAITQALYEKHKCVSYPRTEYRHLTQDNRKMIPEIVSALKGKFEDKYLTQVLRNFEKPNPRIFDNAKVGDHHALIPTATAPKNLSVSEEKIYALIVHRFLAAFAPDHTFTLSLVASVCAGHVFASRGKIIRALGWKEIEADAYEGREEKNSTKTPDPLLPSLQVGELVFVQKLNLKEDKTKAPPHYNDASLLSAMQNPASKTQDADQKELLRECGLGTPATRSAIIKKLETVGYLKRENKNILPCVKAFELMDMLSKFKQEFLTNPVMTAQWEKNLKEIELHPSQATTFLDKLNALNFEIVKNVKEKINEAKEGVF